VLALQAADDNRLSARGLKMVRRVAKNADTDIRMLPSGSHVLTRGELKTEVFDAVKGFVDKRARAGGWTPSRTGSGPDPRSDPS
jgi:hypothetical protein